MEFWQNLYEWLLCGKPHVWPGYNRQLTVGAAIGYVEAIIVGTFYVNTIFH